MCQNAVLCGNGLNKVYAVDKLNLTNKIMFLNGVKAFLEKDKMVATSTFSFFP